MTLLKRRLVAMAIMMVAVMGTGIALTWHEGWLDRTAANKDTAQRLFALQDAKGVQRVAITNPHGHFVMERHPEDPSLWRLTAPKATEAEAQVVEGIVRGLFDARATLRVGGGQDDDFIAPVAPPADLGLYGLAPPRYTVTFTDKSGQGQTLLVGKRNSFDGSIYVQRPEQGDVALTAGTLQAQLEHDLYQLREKRALALMAEDIAEVTITKRKGTAVQMQRREGALWLTKPVQALADTVQAGAVIDALTGLRAKSFASDTAPDATTLHTFGLDREEFLVNVTDVKGQAYVLRFGAIKLGGENHYFVHVDGQPSVLALGSDWVFKKLSTDAQVLRDKTVLHFATTAVTTVRIEKPDAPTLVLTRSRDDKTKQDAWQVTSPSQQGAATFKVASFLNALHELKGTDVVDEAPAPSQAEYYGFGKPAMIITLQSDTQDVLATLRVGATSKDTVFVTNHDMKPVFSVPSADLQLADTADAFAQEPTASRDTP